jgi:hypothetical protein
VFAATVYLSVTQPRGTPADNELILIKLPAPLD